MSPKPVHLWGQANGKQENDKTGTSGDRATANKKTIHLEHSQTLKHASSRFLFAKKCVYMYLYGYSVLVEQYSVKQCLARQEHRLYNCIVPAPYKPCFAREDNNIVYTSPDINIWGTEQRQTGRQENGYTHKHTSYRCVCIYDIW